MDVSDEERDGAIPECVAKKQQDEEGIHLETVCVAAPAAPAVKEKKKRYDESDDWWNPAIKKGKRVGKTKKGVWRRVPGFPKKAILVSSKGWVQTWSVQQKAWERPKRGSERIDYYLEVKVHGSDCKVHKLICRAFKGAPPSRKHTTDHIAKYGDKRMERQDNRAKNLDWEDAPGQNKNRTRTDAPCSDDRPLEVRSDRPREGWTPGEWVRFQSQGKARQAMGVVQGTVSVWLAGKCKCRTGWRLRWAEPDEPQYDLPATGEDPIEAWKKVDDATWISKHGRAWQPYRNSRTWRKFTPRAKEGTGGYARITVGGKRNMFHVVVLDAYLPGVRGNRTVDHINRNKGDNRLANLRPATRSEQMHNQTRKPPSERQNSMRPRVRYRRADAPDDAPWERCLGARELARRRTKATGNTYGFSATSNASVGKYNGKHKYKDYVFYKIWITDRAPWR